jgi:hypothetical protein
MSFDALRRLWHAQAQASYVAGFPVPLPLPPGPPVRLDACLLVSYRPASCSPSEVGAYQIGQSFFEGSCGLPKDPSQARFWLKKVVDGCAHKHLSPNGRANAAKWLRELDGAGD